MKIFIYLIAISTFMFFHIGESFAEIRILPLGDSITRGVDSTDQNGYRRSLYNSLSASYSVDFVGPLQNGAMDFDRDHAGYSGWRTDEINVQLPAWLNTYTPDIILYHLGTNDVGQGDSEAQVVIDIEASLDIIDAYEATTCRHIVVFLARIVNWRTPGSYAFNKTEQINLAIQVMADARILNGDNIIVVDQEHALIYPDDIGLSCLCHPTDSGYQKMADEWFAYLNPYLAVACNR